jgi:hypothetical protein
VAADDWGRVAVSLYDTGRLVVLAPWLAGHRARIDFLCRQQRPDGGWSWPDGYELVPTLSATTALLTEQRRRPPGPDRDRLAGAAAAGVRALRRWLEPGTRPVPDTIGVELIVPALLEDLTGLLAGPGLPLPAPLDPGRLAQVRARFAAGAAPMQSWACLEVFGSAAVAAPSVQPATGPGAGSVGCSAAATAAWLGGPGGHPQAHHFLDRLQARGGGPVPGVTPVTYFEAAWVLNSLSVGELAPGVPAALLDRLDAGLTPLGAPAAPGLPPDADDTAAVLLALLRHGRVRRPDCLLRFRAEGYFRCFPEERSPSVSTNAHVLEALALYLARRPEEASRFAAPAASAAEWLLAQQRPDGSWQDKWHASGCYATACCALALARLGSTSARQAVSRARRWVLDSQRPEGSWGRWVGTVEETAYAVQILARTRSGPAFDAAATEAIRRGREFLAGAVPADHPPLWHAKDLYTPVVVVEAARLAAWHLAGRHLTGRVPARQATTGS